MAESETEPDTPPSTDELEDIRAQRARSARQQAATVANNVAPQVASPESQMVAGNGSNTLEQTEDSAFSATSNSSLNSVSAEQVMQFILRIQAAGNANIDPQLLALLSQPRQPTPRTTPPAARQNAPPDSSENTPSTSGNVPRIQAADNANIDPRLLGQSHQPTPRTTPPATGQNALPENAPSQPSSGHMPPTADGSEPPMDNISEQRGRKRTQPQASVVQSTGRVTRQNKKKKP